MRHEILLGNLTGGGAERVALTLAEGLRSRGLDIGLVVAERKGELADRLPPGVPLDVLGTASPKETARALKARYRTSPPATVMPILDHMLAAALLANLGVRGGPAVLATFHSVPSRVYSTDAPGYAKRRRILLRLLRRGIRRAIAVSAGVAGELPRIFGIPVGDIVTIPNPAVSAAFLAEAARAPEPPVAAPYVLAAGRLVPVKRFDLAIRAFARIAPSRPDLRLVVAGEGPERESLKNLAREVGVPDRVELLGFRPDVARLYGRAEAYLLTSDAESFSLTLVEAMAAGTPVVATDCPYGPREVLADGRWGPLVPPGDADALADALAQTLDGERAPAPPEAWAAYDVERVLDRYEEVYRTG